MRAHLAYPRAEWRHITVGSLLMASAMGGLMVIGGIIL